MLDFSAIENEFLQQVITKIEDNLADENFGVSELAESVHMSRSNLLRKIKQLTSQSASVFIRQVRLYHAMEMLKEGSLTISEVSYKVGFNSTSYFIKCFKDEYGFPPGELGKQEVAYDNPPAQTEPAKEFPVKLTMSGMAAAIVVLLVVWLLPTHSEEPLEKSIAVLPFKNDSPDSSNVYIVNGLMEAILNHLQKIEDIRVVSRTSVEQYRNNLKSIPEIAKELNVSYLVEGSGQKVGDQILLSVQLIEAPRDKHLWSQQYNREVNNVFKIQADVARNIALQVEAIMTPEVEDRLDKIPTQNMEAYDLYLKGLEYSRQETHEGLIAAIDLFEEAIDLDPNFAQPYAMIAVCYYYLDIFRVNQQYAEEINTYADKALLLDPDAWQSMMAKAYYYRQVKEYELAVEYLEKVLRYYPNSGWASNSLAEIYTWYLPDTRKYLHHALQAQRVNVALADSTAASISFLHLSNALVQAGFLEEAEESILQSLAYNQHNIFSQYVYAYIQLGKDQNMERTLELLKVTLEKDTTRVDVLQEIGKMCYYLHDYEQAMKYYDRFIAINMANGLNIFPAENGKIAYSMEKMGRLEESAKLFAEYKAFADQDQSTYRDLTLAAYYAHHGEEDLAIEHLKTYASQGDFIFWMTLFLKDEPLLESLVNHPEFSIALKEIDDKFWQRHKETRTILKAEGLL